ncbi:hypothetical protein GZH47_33190 (plasmid) [Paenibacillus rhizovicinus]|uniref:Uncharacterized protein n=1 Tax=Paenibacillus rhizovicinus TaxID=2704463 RepID=A0A6C0PAZ6_9BACL|nr:hypothetical protein [Paenibacillus rhizovicinus]QHW35750.1 hypothetical protein GZH47_33190 [Paenibacillus rhizovicinus]
MSLVLTRLVRETSTDWESLVHNYEQENRALLVPSENSAATLHRFNVRLSELFTRAHYDFARARRNKDAVERLVENVIKDYYNGPNELARKAAGIQYARCYPAPEEWHADTVDLFDLEDRFRYYFYSLESTIKTLAMKSEAKITNNSLLKLEKDLTG